jgi:hypothetical protein
MHCHAAYGARQVTQDLASGGRDVPLRHRRARRPSERPPGQSRRAVDIGTSTDIITLSEGDAWENARRAAVLVGGPMAKRGSPIAPELGDMGR